jgi:hypothetical protein
MQKIFLGLVGALLLYELYALSDQRAGDTISEIIWKAAATRPILPFAMGVLMGHLFWQKAGS